MTTARRRGVLSLAKPSSATLDALVREQRDEDLTYPQVGATMAALPSGYWHGRHAVGLGEGPDVFRRACDGLRRWQAHGRAGVHVHPQWAEVEEGLTVVLAVPVVSLYVTVACRVVAVTREDARFGFAYGTLPHHLIEGEEAFFVERDDQDNVWFLITSFARPRGRLARPVGPLEHALDQRIVQRYLRGLQQHAAQEV